MWLRRLVLMRSRRGLFAGSRIHLNPVRILNGDSSGGQCRRDPCGFENRFELAGADDCINLGNVLADLISVALHQASGDDQLSCRAGSLEASHLENRIHRLLLGRVDKTAGVYDQDFSLFRMGGQSRAGAIEQAHHHLGVDEVFGAA